ncbi:MAG: hypothetical protein WD080_01385, partial [Egibacteraceae bacterium]
MFVQDTQSAVVTARRCRRRVHHARTPAGLMASEQPVGYHTGRDQATESVNDDHGGDGGGTNAWAVGSAPRTVQARSRLTRCATTPGSPLGAIMGALAETIDALTTTVGAPTAPTRSAAASPAVADTATSGERDGLG